MLPFLCLVRMVLTFRYGIKYNVFFVYCQYYYVK